jgi:lysophospholipase L1-like esterase
MLESSYPRTNYNTVASGVGGEQASGGFSRFESSVGNFNPDIIIIAYGTNDSENSISKYKYYLDGLIKKAKSIGALVFIQNFGPIITDENPDKVGYEDFIVACRQVANENGVPYIDVYSRLSQDPSRYLVDWAHYSPEGSAVVSQIAYQNIIGYLDGYGVRK